MDKNKEKYSDLVGRSLGSENSYAISTDKFDPTLLNPIPRKEPRDEWGIKGSEFEGYDVWTCHEATFLTDKGIPVAGTLRFVYNSSYPYIIESKSMKLYLNTFDMCKMGSTIKEATENYEEQISRDLSRVLECPVDVRFHSSTDYENDVVHSNPFHTYIDLHSIVKGNEEDIEITDYKGNHKHFRTYKNGTRVGPSISKVFTNVLRSRCRHTKQKDTGTAFIHLKIEEGVEVDMISLFKEVVCLREVDEFHEFCAEKLFTRISNTPGITDCMVALLYSRRGSLDINPVRTTSLDLIPQTFTDVTRYIQKTQGQ